MTLKELIVAWAQADPAEIKASESMVGSSLMADAVVVNAPRHGATKSKFGQSFFEPNLVAYEQQDAVPAVERAAA